ncbi:MAG: hypothetical protein BGO38_00885 [Cellulomonas sp. 73-145]|uniref:hypothetical protein n=1 Tax=Cellulomonas sp. 73-145 TaxID=1895739 RepID=UPI000927EA18|nr:hypothetical protein [Cellulomonas sp. 73-145]MBN9327298.1 hypothetical protein [Cellulomonas sp.]OJV60134.1 MAG: hypothetical protein BGO38_00885 [Cellulomonas sp. 73-145]
MRRTRTREFAADLLFSGVLIAVAELVFRVTELHRLYALVIVFVVGHALRAFARGWRQRRSDPAFARQDR